MAFKEKNMKKTVKIDYQAPEVAEPQVKSNNAD
jgi:hypothetical protein